MPTHHLTEAERQGFARFGDTPSADQLARYFHLDETDRTLITGLRGDHNRLGFAVMLTGVRFLGAFPSGRDAVPAVVLHTLCDQLDLTAPVSLELYFANRQRIRHLAVIRAHLGLTDFGENAGARFRLLRWLFTLCSHLAGQEPADHSGQGPGRTRPHRQNAAWSAHHRRTGLPPPHPRAVEPAGAASQTRPPPPSRRPRRDPKPSAPRTGGAARIPRVGPERHHPLERHLHAGSPAPARGKRNARSSRRRRQALPHPLASHQCPRPLRVRPA